MNQRTLKLLEIRPVVDGAKVLNDSSAEERFQNQTLRPILKLQNDLLVVSFQNYIIKGKNRFYGLKKEARLDYITHAIKKDIKYQTTIKGMILGQFTKEEFLTYSANAPSLKKRIVSMTIKRLHDQLQIFEAQGLVQ